MKYKAIFSPKYRLRINLKIRGIISSIRITTFFLLPDRTERLSFIPVVPVRPFIVEELSVSHFLVGLVTTIKFTRTLEPTSAKMNDSFHINSPHGVGKQQ